jgi:hypothetical protein
MSKCIDKAIVDRADEQDPAITWDWIKFQQKVSSLKYSKNLARLRRDNIIKAEQRYALALATHSADLIEARAELQKFVEREDEVIRFRAGVDQVEKGEKATPFFFNQIQSKRLQSNVTCLKTDRFPGGTVARKETMSELESHFKNEFAEPQATSFVDPKWWEDLPQIDSNLRDKLDSDPTLNEITRVLFKESKDGKAPGDDGLTNRYYKTF